MTIWRDLAALTERLKGLEQRQWRDEQAHYALQHQLRLLLDYLNLEIYEEPATHARTRIRSKDDPKDET